MRCSQCQQVNPEGARFCNACGARLEAACPACGQVSPPGSRFCNGCGHDLAQPPSPAPVASPGSPQSYTPKHLAEQILTTRGALEGERKQVTVLFCDIVDSSQLAERVDPEVMHELMDQVLRLTAEAVHRYEGTVNQYLGDGLMALFGAPVALEDHAFRAVHAALAIQETIAGYSIQLQRTHGVEMQLRLGLNTGLVVVGRIGDDLRMDYTAVGNTTHLAARMQTLAGPGMILLTEATHRLVEGYIRSEALGPVEVKGQRTPVQVYKVTGRRRWRSRLEVSAERGLSPFVGRQRELALLQDCFTRAEEGHGQVVGIVGEAGVGKSRLLYELHTALPPERVHWLIGHCVAHGQTTPYLPILEVLRTNFQIDEEDNPLQIQEKLRQGVHLLDLSVSETLPFLEALFGLPGAEDALRHLAPKDKRQQTFEAIRALAIAGSQLRPHVLVVENLHWLDQTSEGCLAMLIESLVGFPILVLTTHRPGYTVRWADKTYYTQITPNLLTDAEAGAMVATLLGSRSLPPGLLQFIQEKASGNPLFIEEVTQALMERGLLTHENGGITWTSDAAVAFPDTIQDIMRARIDRLQEPVKRTVQTAAVIGREFALRLLTRISERPNEVPRDLGTLTQAELVHEARLFPELAYRFKHAVIQDVAYESLLVQRRQALHGAIGQVIEELWDDHLEEQASVLTYHYSRSLHPDKAVAYALLAGDRAARLYARTEATTYYIQALTIARALAPSPETHRAQIDAIVKLAAVGMTGQDIERDRHHLEQAHALAEALADEHRLTQVLYWQGRIQYVRGDYRAAMAFAEQSLTIADRLGDESLSAPSVNLLGRSSWSLSDYAHASRLLARNTEQMHRLGNTTEEATAAAFAGITFGFLGQFDQALTYADHGLRLAQELRNPFAEAAAYHYRAQIHDQRGAWTQAIADCEEARRLASGAGDLFRIYVVKFLEGRAHTMAGSTERGRVLLEESLALSTQLGTAFLLAWAKAFLAMCHLALGAHDVVLPLCREAITLAEGAGEKYPAALAHRTLAEALFALAPTERPDAERAMLEAIRIQAEIGNEPELARSYVSYAPLLRGWGEAAKAREYLTQAIGMFQKMGMAWDQALAERGLRA